MKKAAILLLLLTGFAAFSQIKWMTLTDALAAQKNQPKKILIDFFADWCGPCKTMDNTTYSHPFIVEHINTHYYPVKFDAESGETLSLFGKVFGNPQFVGGRKKNSLHEFTKFMNVSSVPSIVFLDESGNQITILNGLLSAREIEPYLSMISSNDYKKVQTRAQWDAYQKRYKSKIKD